MDVHADTNSQAAESWDLYWRGAGDGAYASQGVNHPAFVAFWDEAFTAVRANSAAPRLLDLAAGAGAVIDRAYRAFGSEMPVACLDVSPGAICVVTSRWPAVSGIVADARAIPLATGHFDLVTSQFGVEYAGPEAFREMLIPVARGGRIALLIHHSSGLIHRECAAGLDAMRRVDAAGFIPNSVRMFEAGFAACRGGDRSLYDAASLQLLPAFRVLEAIMAEHGTHVAGDVVLRLYRDVDRIHERIAHYDPAEVLSWLRRMDHEIQAYAERMTAMCQAALDERSFGRLIDDLRSASYAIQRAEPLRIPGRKQPLAWALLTAYC